jgi:hypothetical protein
MWIAKDNDCVCIFENKPEQSENGFWYSTGGYYFEIPSKLVYEILGRNLKSDETVEIEIKKI